MLTIPFHLQDFLKDDLLHSIFLFEVINLLKSDILSGIKKFHEIKTFK